MTSWTVACQASLSLTILSSGICSDSGPQNHLCYLTISSSATPFYSYPQSFPASRSFPMSWLFTSGGQILELQLQHQSFQCIYRVDFLWNLLIWSPCCSRDSQESSPAPHFESINSLALKLLYGPTLIFVHDYWKNHSFDYMDLCQQSHVSALKYTIWVCHSFSSKEQASFNFMAAVIYLSIQNLLSICYRRNSMLQT